MLADTSQFVKALPTVFQLSSEILAHHQGESRPAWATDPLGHLTSDVKLFQSPKNRAPASA